MKITDTSKIRRDDWLFGGSPRSIERQEATGQLELCRSKQLPTDGLDAIAESLGIKIIGPSSGDDLFSDVVLLEGWSVRPTGQSMWSELVSDTGAVVASIFYKAAFYDRHAFIRAGR